MPNTSSSPTRSTFTPPTESPSYLQFLDSLVKMHSTIMLDCDTAKKGASFELLVRQITPICLQSKKVITVHQAVMNELRYLSGSANVDAQTRERASRAVETINALSYAGVFCFKGDPNERRSGRECILRYVSENIFREDILVLTQSVDLASDCMLFTKIKSAHLNHTVTVKRISNQYGQLNNFMFDDNKINTSQPIMPASAAVDNNVGTILRRFGL